MLIKALSEYYDILEKTEKVVSDGYSNVKVHYLVCLTADGNIDEITNSQMRELTPSGKEKWVPKNCVMPKRTEKPGIDANIIEHRPLYIFGLNYVEQKDSSEVTAAFSPEDKTNKAKKSHDIFVKENLKFLDGLDSPAINAYRAFLQNWNPAEETQNSLLLELGKEYGKSGFAFCLSGYPDELLHEERQIKEKWEQMQQNKNCADEKEKSYVAQCAVSGKTASIARVHSKIKGIYGGLATGSVLISFKNASEESYGNTQSYNSNISENVMRKYTEALNYLLEGQKHKIGMDDLTVIFWAMSKEEQYEDLIMAMLLGQTDKMSAEQTEDMLRKLMKDSTNGRITEDRLRSLDVIDPNVEFYMVGLKPNSSRLSVKFIYRKRYADILWNMAHFQSEMQVSKNMRPVSFTRMKLELLSPKSKNDKVNPALLAKIFEAVMYGGRYPTALLETMVRRVKIDGEYRINDVRAGVIKACLMRNYKKEELKVGLNEENNGQAYLCGRLFAVLERLQQDASGNSLNRTIKDAYFASASSKPALVFPKLVKLAQNHLNKVKAPVFYNKQIGEIVNRLDGKFPDTLLLVEQGEFIVGYYQQYQTYFEKREKTEQNENVVE